MSMNGNETAAVRSVALRSVCVSVMFSFFHASPFPSNGNPTNFLETNENNWNLSSIEFSCDVEMNIEQLPAGLNDSRLSHIDVTVDWFRDRPIRSYMISPKTWDGVSWTLLQQEIAYFDYEGNSVGALLTRLSTDSSALKLRRRRRSWRFSSRSSLRDGNEPQSSPCVSLLFSYHPFKSWPSKG